MPEQFTAILLVIQVVYAQAPRAHEPAVGQLLVATRKSHDPDLKQTVILLVHYDQDGAIGLILNRKSNKKDQPFYFGGPINLGTRVLLRARTRPADAERIVGDFYVLRNPTRLPASTVFRVYAGYTGWSIQQLRDELSLGLWTVLPGDAATIFDPNPDTMWPRLVR